jgi:DnaK suppressor protein
MSHLKQEELQHLRTLLEERRRVLSAEMRELLHDFENQHHQDLAGMVSDAGDESVANMLTHIGTAIADRDVQELRQIEVARGRLAAGEYGVCAGCGGEIPYERLAASPTVAGCIECQERTEKTSLLGGALML